MKTCSHICLDLICHEKPKIEIWKPSRKPLHDRHVLLQHFFFYQKIRVFDFPIFRCRQDLQAICCIHALHKDEPANCGAAMHRLSCWHLTSWGRNVLPCISCSFLLFAQGQSGQTNAMLCQNVKPGRQEGVENQIFLGLVANEIEPAPRSKGQWWSMLRSVTLPPDSSHVENGALHSYHHFYGRKGKPVNPSANQSLAHMYFNPPIVEVKTWRQCCDSLPVTRGSSNFKTTGLCSIRPCQR